MRNFSKAFFICFLATFLNFYSASAQSFPFRSGTVILDPTLDPEKYQARYAYIPPKGVIRLQNRQNSQIVYVKVVDTIAQPKQGWKVHIAVSKKAYDKLQVGEYSEIRIEYKKQDKLWYKLIQAPEGIAKIELRYELANELFFLDHKAQADSLVKTAFRLSQKYKYDNGVAVGHYFLAKLGTQGDPLKHLEQYLAFREKSPVARQRVGAYSFAGELYKEKQQFLKAIVYGRRLIKTLRAHDWGETNIRVNIRKVSRYYKALVFEQLLNGQLTAMNKTFPEWINFLEEGKSGESTYGKMERVKCVFLAYEQMTGLMHEQVPDQVFAWYKEWWQWIKNNNIKDAQDNKYANLFLPKVINRYLQYKEFGKATECALWAMETDQEVCKTLLRDLLTQVASADVETKKLTRFLKTVRSRIPRQWYNKLMKGLRFTFISYGSEAIENKDLGSAKIYFERLENLSQQSGNTQEVIWTLGRIAYVYARQKYFDKALKYNQQLIIYLQKKQQKPVKIRETQLQQSVWYRQNLQYSKSLQILMRVTQTSGFFPDKWLKKTVDLMLKKPLLPKQRQQVKDKLQQWKQSLENRGNEKAVTFVVTQLKRLEE